MTETSETPSKALGSGRGPCSVPDCGTIIYSQSLCSKHYQRLRKHGSTEPAGRRRDSQPDECLVAGCDSRPQARGWCNKHYCAYQRYGDPLGGRTFRKRGEPQSCEVEGCDTGTPYYADGLCGTHYGRRQRFGTVGGPHRTAMGNVPARRINDDGYVVLTGGKLEHRHMWEQANRPLLPGETVHHKNGVRHDNRLDNFELWVTHQPSGQRPEDLLVWADEIIRRYR